jgi:hypothetical protein
MKDRIARLIAVSNSATATEELPVEGLSEEELIERKAIIVDELATRRGHAAAATAQYDTLTSGEKYLLIAAAQRSDQLFLALASGEWNLAVRALRGYVVTHVAKVAQPGYRELIVKLDCLTTSALDGEVVIMEARRQSAAETHVAA